ncbi:MAG: hypothetical protein NTX64_08940 [Elusimicrobia bacterium]|nr:hypothetical protein [Elusimicrobiota bacterium]
MKPLLRRTKERLLTLSLRAAAAEQGLADLAGRLQGLAVDLDRQYTDHRINTDYLRTKVLCQQAFQMAFTLPELESAPRTIVDIGDSAGTHIGYLKALKPGLDARFVSLNLDAEAVKRIQAKGIEALLARAEDIGTLGIKPDIALLFETLEHLPDPFDFLHRLASRTSCKKLILTVPYVRASRLGLHHLREGIRKPVSAETVHLLELCPKDLRLLFAHTGWRVARERVYLQYPRFSPLALMRPLWARWDFEGFYAAALEPDPTWSSLYGSWS